VACTDDRENGVRGAQPLSMVKLRRTVRILRAFSWALPLFGGACTRSAAMPRDDGERIVQATLRLLTSDGKPICIDDRTTGRPLAIYATMRMAPLPSGQPLAWHTPGPLRPPVELSNTQLYHDSLGSESAHLRDPDNGGASLPWMLQRRLDETATVQARAGVDESVMISSRWAPGVRARWWPVNRLSRHCSPTYTLSNPTWSASTGYITVMTEHWGATYGLDRGPTGWRPVGQWTNWLY